MGIYAALGVGQALTAFFMGLMFSLVVYSASQRLHHVRPHRFFCVVRNIRKADMGLLSVLYWQDAINRVMHAPMSFFETTPVGRIMNRFSKDVDTMDNILAGALAPIPSLPL